MNILCVCVLVLVASFAQCATVEVKADGPLDWTVDGKNPLKEARDAGKTALVIFLKGGCTYCQSQAVRLNAWFKRFQLSSANFQLIIVNMVGDNEVQNLKDRLTDTVSYTSYHQDKKDTTADPNTPSTIQEKMKAVKDDFFLFNAAGDLVKGEKSNGAFHHRIYEYIAEGENMTDYKLRCLCPVLSTLLHTLSHNDKCAEFPLLKEIKNSVSLWIRAMMIGNPTEDAIVNKTKKAVNMIQRVLVGTVTGMKGHHHMGGGRHYMGGGYRKKGGHGMGKGHGMGRGRGMGRGHGMGGGSRKKGGHGMGGGY